MGRRERGMLHALRLIGVERWRVTGYVAGALCTIPAGRGASGEAALVLE